MTTVRELASGFPVRFAGVVVLYFFGAMLGLTFAVVGSTVSLVWPPSGIALVAVLTFGRRIAGAIALGAFLANAWTGVALSVAALIAVGNTLEAVVGALLLERVVRFKGCLKRRRDVLALIALAAILSTTVSASIGSLALVLGDIVAFDEMFSVALIWWLGDMMGVLVVAPPLLAFVHHTRPVLSFQNSTEALFLIFATTLVAHLVFNSHELSELEYYPAALAVFPFVIWAALRFDHWGVIVITFIISIMAILGTTQGLGPFAVPNPVDSLIRWCTFVNVLAVTGLLLAASNTEQRLAHDFLKRSHLELERRVEERTMDLARINAGLKQQMAERRALESKLISLSEDQQKNIGRELHDGLGQHLTSVAFFGATLHHQLDVLQRPEAPLARRIVELANQSIDMARAISKGLYPVSLESEGLAAALTQLADNTNALHKVECSFRGDPDVIITDPQVSINLYRIAQEALNNAIKHSEASHIWIDLFTRDRNIQLAVSDNGVGMDPAMIESHQGLGLNNFRYRASLLDGFFFVENNSLGGTTVSIVYPAQTGEDDDSRTA